MGHLDQGSFSRWVARIGRHKQALYRVVTVQLYRVVTVQTHTHDMRPGPDLEPEKISAAMRQKMGGTMTITLALLCASAIHDGKSPAAWQELGLHFRVSVNQKHSFCPWEFVQRIIGPLREIGRAFRVARCEANEYLAPV